MLGNTYILCKLNVIKQCESISADDNENGAYKNENFAFSQLNYFKYNSLTFVNKHKIINQCGT